MVLGLSVSGFAECWPAQLNTGRLYIVVGVVRATVCCGSRLTAMVRNGASLPRLSVAYHYMLYRSCVCLPYLVVGISCGRVDAFGMTCIGMWRGCDYSSRVREDDTAVSRWPGRIKGCNGVDRVRRACLIRSFASVLRVHAIRLSQRLATDRFSDRLSPRVWPNRYADSSWERTCYANIT